MMKWFRRYNRHMMVGLVAFLMISFLIQDSLTRQSDRRNMARDFGQVRGKLVDAEQFQSALQTRSILESLGLPWQMPWFRFEGVRNQLGLSPLKTETFTLLLLEARNAKVEVPDSSVDKLMTDLQSLGQAGVNYVDMVRRQRDLKTADIRAALADYIRILRYSELVMGSLHVSEDEIRHYVRDTSERVQFSFVSFPAEKFIDKNQTFSTAEMQEQFNKYRDVAPPADGSEFGYKWPRRVRLEYLSINSADTRPLITVTEDQARAYFQEHKANYVRMLPPLTTQSASAPASATASAPASAPSTAPVRRQMTFREARAEVEESLRDERARTRAREMMDAVLSEIDKPWVLGRGDDGFQRRPAGVDAPDYLENVAKQMTNRLGVPVSYHRTNLLTQSDFSKGTKRLGDATPAETAAGGANLVTAAFDVPPFAKPKKDSDTGESLTLFQPCGTVYSLPDPAGKTADLLAFRVIEAHEPEPPATLDEVKDKVIADLRLQRANVVADGLASRLYAAARVGGLRAALAADPQLKDLAAKPGPDELAMTGRDPVVETPALPRRYRSFGYGIDIPVSVPGLSNTTGVLDAAFELASDNWQSPPASAPATQIAMTQPAVAATQPTPKVRLFEIPRSHNRIVMEFRKLDPVREDQYQMQRTMAENMLLQLRQQEYIRNWFAADSITRRMQYKPAGREAG